MTFPSMMVSASCARSLDSSEKRQIPLSELKVEPGSPSYQMVDDYITWFVNSPEDGVDDDPDDDWDEEG